MSERPPISPRSPRAALEPEQVPPPPKRSERARNPFVVAGNAIITIVLILMIGVGGGYIYGRQKIEAPGPLQEDKIVNIPARADRFGGGGTRSGSSAARGLLGEMGGLSLIDVT